MSATLVRVKFICRLGYGDSLPKDEEFSGDVPVFGSNGQYATTITRNTGVPAIVLGRKGSYGKVNWASDGCFASDTTFFVDDRLTSSNLRWLYWSLQTLGLDEGSQEAAVPGLNRESVYEERICFPSLIDQAKIANYLDRETARIDGLISEKERMLALLEEKCVALINQVVTRGLDPNVPLKPSGQEWLGEIPAHWDLLPLRWFMHIGSGEFLPNESISSEKTDGMQIPVVGGNGVLGYSSLENTQDALVIGRVGALCGNVHFFDGPLWVTDNALLVELASRFNPKYMREVLKLMKLNSLANQSAQPLITGETIKAQKVPAPSSQEQEDIFRFLKDKYIVHDLLSDELKTSLHVLKERRAALITAAVTGQIPLEEMDG